MRGRRGTDRRQRKRQPSSPSRQRAKTGMCGLSILTSKTGPGWEFKQGLKEQFRSGATVCSNPDESIAAQAAGMASAGAARVEAGIVQVFEISSESQLAINTHRMARR